ncbi:ABC transporter ATP-binding protein [Desulfogranum marinum]|uniref:ABC transporter ATP-binding protein n=1 Tax=Desulfogranum marinum TaxID=453220 RepID=UPI0019629086|nr:ABC transporter ATP-binding protein [Desulfogranum marinum]MBM9513008.1 ABC transporter ATP-binding protein [Desulfogranum marinum]
MFVFVTKMLELLSAAERREMYWLFIAMILLACIEVASIGSIMPFVTVVANPDVIVSNDWLAWFYSVLHFQSDNAFLLTLGGIVLFVLVVSNLSTAVITWWIFRFSWMRNHSLARRLFAKYLYEPYVFFLNRNTAELEKNILDEVQLIIVGVLNPLLMIVKNGVVILFIFLFLVAMEPTLAIIVSITLGSAYCTLFLISGKMLSRIGWERAKANKKRFRFASEALSGIKVLRVLGREKFFLDQFSIHSYRVSYNFAKKAIVAQLPKYAFEIIAFGGVLIIILYFLATKKDLEQVIPILSLYAFAGYRLMPAMQTIFTKAANIRYALPALDILHEDISRSVDARDNITSGNEKEMLCLRGQSIRLDDVHFAYPGQDSPVLKQFNLYIPGRTTVGFAGPTGSGKTTIIDIILGLLSPQHGNLLVDNTLICEANVKIWQKKIGYVPQDIFLTDESVAKNIALGVPEEDIDMGMVIEVAKIANLHDFVMTELPASYDTVVGERGIRLSGGQKQRIGLARALYHDPEVLILDEATSALDGLTENAIMQAIDNLSSKKTILMIAHRLTTLQKCDEIFVLDKGEIVAHGTYNELAENSKYFQDIKKLEG